MVSKYGGTSFTVWLKEIDRQTLISRALKYWRIKYDDGLSALEAKGEANENRGGNRGTTRND